jgi:hypothetical protein
MTGVCRFRFQPRTSLSAASTELEGFGVVWTGSDDVEVSYLQDDHEANDTDYAERGAG